MRVEGLRELVSDLERKITTIDKDVFRVQWRNADAGAAAAKGLAPKATGALADSIEPGTYNIPGGVRAVWGPTVRYGIFVEVGTSKMAPQPYLSPSLDQIEGSATGALADTLDL